MAQESLNPEVPDKLLTEFTPNTKEEWREAVDKLLKGKPYEKIMLTKTYEGITLDPLYRREDTENNAFLDNLPGEFPFVRGTKPLGYLEKPWNVAQEIPYATAKEFNEALLYDLNRGQTAVNIVLDKATLRGKDPQELTKDLVGDGGLSLSTLNDLAIALKDVVLDCIDIDIHAYSSSIYLQAMLIALAKEKNIDIKKLSGSIGCDPIGQLVTDGKLPTTLDEIYHEMYLSTKWAVENAPKLRTIAVHSHPYINAGSNVIDELGYVFATAIDYLNQMLERGLTIDEVAPRIQFNLTLSSNFFMEISKIRAARVIWSNIVVAYGGSKESQKMYIHGRTATWNKTIYDPYVNMLRTTTEAFSAIMGGVDSLHVGTFDEVIRKPDEFSRRIARNQQIILNEECHFNHVIDPVGGSWYIESLTDMVADKVWEKVQSLSKKDFTLLLKEGVIQSEIAEVVEQRIKNMNIRKDVVVGTNMFANISEKPLEQRSDDKEKLFNIRKNEVANSKKEISLNLDKDDFNSVIDAFSQGATLEQVASAFRTGGSYEINPLKITRATVHFEELRKKIESLDKKPTVLLLGLGSLSQYKARMDFSRGFFEVGGLTVVDKGGFESTEEAAKYALSQDVDAVVICSTDDNYPEIVPEIMNVLKGSGKISVLAGYPKDQIESHKESGIDFFIHVRANVYDTIIELLKKIGVKNV